LNAGLPGLPAIFFLGEFLEVHRRQAWPNNSSQRRQDVVND